MTSTQDEAEVSYSDGDINILSQPDDHFTIKSLFLPANTEPSPLSGLAVKICTSILGKTKKDTR